MKTTVSQCPIEDAMRLLGGRWRTLLIYYLIDGPKRFSDLRRDNPTISHRMLALDLRELESAGVISRTVYPTVPPQVEYELTSDGKKLVPLVNALGDWWEDLQGRRMTIVQGDAVSDSAVQRARA
ncbi:MAG: helix-turn-helix transcriptional regulator [Rhizobiales bacterium]|nr:helix-turn-helix transcriptional regulator [Hyphomicrobiales bacterium]